MQVYTDGACSGNPGPGGWSYVVIMQGQQQISAEHSGGESETTNNRMELMASIKALEYVKATQSQKVTLWTDSTYVRDGITQWIHKWQRNDWHTNQGTPVKNEALWRQLHALNHGLQIQWQWVKGHSGCVGNERADQLAKQAVKMMKMSSLAISTTRSDAEERAPEEGTCYSENTEMGKKNNAAVAGSPTKDYEMLLDHLKLLGLQGTLTESKLQRYRRYQRDRYGKLADSLQQFNHKLLKQTPANHIFLVRDSEEEEDSDGSSPSSSRKFYPVFQEAKILKNPLSLDVVHRLHNGGDGATAMCGTDGFSVNQRLYRLIRSGKLELRDDMTRSNGDSTLPRCSQLVFLNKKTKEAYFVGRDGQTARLENALRPFVNLMYRSHGVPEDLGVADGIKRLDALFKQVEQHLSTLLVTDALESEARKIKKARAKKSKSKKDKESALDKALKKNAEKKSVARKKLKEAASGKPDNDKKKRRKVEQMEKIPSATVVPIVVSPEPAVEPEPSKKQKISDSSSISSGGNTHEKEEISEPIPPLSTMGLDLQWLLM